jgi:putative oxidoreductase
VTAITVALLRFIGVAKFAGGLGLILPAATRMRPGLTLWAALGLATIMALAFVPRGEMEALPANLVLGGLAALVAWRRWRKAPIQPR